jgi:hypothetical protein
MAKPVLSEAVRKLVQAIGVTVKSSAFPKEPTVGEAIVTIKEHIDKRLVALLSTSSTSAGSQTSGQRYNVAVDLNLERKGKSTQFVEIGDETTVQDVFDHIFYMLEGGVKPYKYLEQWLLRDKATGERLIIREIQSRVHASAIFTIGSKWDVVRLSKPYTADDAFIS